MNQKLLASVVHTEDKILGWYADDRYIGAEDVAGIESISVSAVGEVPFVAVVAEHWL